MKIRTDLPLRRPTEVKRSQDVAAPSGEETLQESEGEKRPSNSNEVGPVQSQTYGVFLLQDVSITKPQRNHPIFTWSLCVLCEYCIVLQIPSALSCCSEIL